MLVRLRRRGAGIVGEKGTEKSETKPEDCLSAEEKNEAGSTLIDSASLSDKDSRPLAALCHQLPLKMTCGLLLVTNSA